MKIEISDETQYGKAANGAMYKGRPVSGGYDAEVRRESPHTALVNIRMPDGSGEWLAEFKVEPNENLQELAVNLANDPGFADGAYVTQEQDGWTTLMERWNRLAPG